MVNYVLAAERYTALITQLGAELGEKRGWKSEVARRLGVRPAYVSMLASGARVSVGRRAIDLAIARLGIDRSFFYANDPEQTPHRAADPDKTPHYRQFLSKDPNERPPQTRQTHPALRAFSAKTELTAEEKRFLESIDFQGRSPTQRTYELILAALRKTTADEEELANSWP